MNELYILKKTVKNCNGWTGIHVDVTLALLKRIKSLFQISAPYRQKKNDSGFK